MVMHLRTAGGVKGAAAAVALTASLGIMAAIAPLASAQDASPVASPSVECSAPEAAAGAAVASPAVEMPAASPVATEAPIGTPADAATTAEAQAAVKNIIACLAADSAKAAALMTPNFMLATFGTADAAQVGQMIAGATFEDLQTGAVNTYEDGRVSVDVTYKQGKYQVVAERWFLEKDGDFWKLDDTALQTAKVEGDTAVVGVKLTEYAFDLGTSSVVQPEVLVFHGSNEGKEMHEIILAKMPEGKTIDDVKADPEAALGGEEALVGSIFLEPGEQGDMTLVGLEPGKYVMICFIPAPDGTPHFMKGMIAEFDVEGV